MKTAQKDHLMNALPFSEQEVSRFIEEAKAKAGGEKAWAFLGEDIQRALIGEQFALVFMRQRATDPGAQCFQQLFLSMNRQAFLEGGA